MIYYDGKIRKERKEEEKTTAPSGNRTHDLKLTRQVFYQFATTPAEDSGQRLCQSYQLSTPPTPPHPHGGLKDRPFISCEGLWVFLEHGVGLRHDGGDDQGLVVQALHDVRVGLGVVAREVGAAALVPNPDPRDTKAISSNSNPEVDRKSIRLTLSQPIQLWLWLKTLDSALQANTRTYVSYVFYKHLFLAIESLPSYQSLSLWLLY